MTPTVFDEQLVTYAGPLPVTATMVSSAVLSIALAITGAGLVWTARKRPRSRVAAAARVIHSGVEQIVEQTAGTQDPAIVRVAFALLAFIGGSAVLGKLPGLRAPTASLGAASALAVVVLMAVPAVGILRVGLWAYVREYFRPNPIFFPLHLISELSRTLALALRLFGNMMSGHLIVALLVAIVGIVVPVPLMALDLLIGALQAYIFTVLACVYMGAALRSGEPA